MKRIKILLSKKQRFYLLLIFIGAFLVSVVETVGLGSIAGFVMILSDPETFIGKVPNEIIRTYLINKEFSDLVILSTICLTLIFVLKNLFVVIFYYCESQIKRNIINSNANKLYSHYLTCDYSFHLQKNPAQLINNVVSEVKRCVDYISFILLCFKEALLVLCLLFTLLFIDWKISFVIFMMMSVISAIFYLSVQKKVKEIGIRVREYSENMLQNLNQGIGAIKITKILGNQNFFINKFHREQDGKLKNEVYHNLYNKLPRLFLEVLSVLTVTLTTLFFILEDRSIHTVLPTLTLLALIVIRMVPAFININLSLTNLQYNSSSVQNFISELEKTYSGNNPTIISGNSQLDFPKRFKNIMLDNVSYNYPGDQKKVLKAISLKIEQNDMVGIIGRSGAGKSTLIDLILGLLTPSKGNIKVNSADISKNLKGWQKRLGYVPQDIYLIDDSVRRNVAFGLNDENIEEKRIEECLKSAQLLDFVKTLPKGLETYIGNRGIRLSGGQRQRLGIARAMYHNPEVLVMDEATSSLDNETEEALIRDISKLSKEKTLIIIAHRLSTLKNCNKLFLFESGELIDQGNIDDIAQRHKDLKPYLTIKE